MDWNTVWIAVGAVGTAIVGIGSLFGFIRRSDMASIDNRFGTVKDNMESINTQILEKAHKDEVRRIEDRFEKDIADLRTDQKTGFAEIRADIKDMRADLMAAIRDAVK